jgi:hypothetical protein
MIITEERLCLVLDVLRHGGEEAISLFLKMSMRLYQTAHPDALRDWITVATPVLPEKERNEVMIMLILEHLPPLAARCGNHPLDTQVTAYSLLGKESGED